MKVADLCLYSNAYVMTEQIVEGNVAKSVDTAGLLTLAHPTVTVDFI